MKKLLVVIVGLAAGFKVWAQETPKAVNEALQGLGLVVHSAEPSPISGFVQVITDRGLFYVKEDGKQLIQGSLYSLEDGVVNESSAAMAKFTSKQMANVADSMIVYKAPNEEHVVTVFTDTTCGYCRKLHREMDEYLAAGITIQYLAFPRAGLNSQSAQTLESIWCSTDQQKAMDVSKAGGSIDALSCTNPVAEHYQFGQQIGINGTPALILENGVVMPGYVQATELKQRLAQN